MLSVRWEQHSIDIEKTRQTQVWQLTPVGSVAKMSLPSKHIVWLSKLYNTVFSRDVSPRVRHL